MLATHQLTREFGGVRAVDAVSLDVRADEIHALIGPNGAGKTTLIALLSGLLRADHGRVLLSGRDITALPAHRRAKLGLARSFQITSVFAEFSAIENVSLAVQASAGHSFRFWQNARRLERLRQPAMAELERVGLGHRAEMPVAAISHGERRQLEIAMALASKPKLLLLDEPMAGMGAAESRDMVELIRSLRGQVPILLVEHDMDAVFALADRVSVLVYGQLIATGSADEERQDKAVQDAYLGETTADLAVSGGAS